jgi:ribonuclease H / adenosylcobalamin/alpha-ribazole phosphatase
VALSSDGLEQAEIVADLIAVEPLAAICSSPRERAYYTARAIADRFEQKVRIVHALDEIDFGDWTGKRFDELEGDPLWCEWNVARGSSRPPGGESMAEAALRARAAIEDLATEYDGGTIAAVSHCDVIRGVISSFLGLPLDNLLRFEIDPASVSRIEVAPGHARILSVNERLYQ